MTNDASSSLPVPIDNRNAAKPATEDTSRWSRALDRKWIIPSALSLGLFVVYAVYGVSRHHQVLTAGYDLGIFSQAVSRYASWSAPIVPLKGLDFNLLGDHFHPILATLAPLWWIFPDPRVLLVAQAALVAASIPAVWLLALSRIGPAWSTVVTLAYGLSWPIQGLIDFDFHEIAFAIPIIAWSIYLYDRGNQWLALGIASFLIFVREDMFAILVAFAILALIQRKWRLSLAFLALSAFGYILAMRLVIPYYSPTGNYLYWSLSQFGPDLPSAVIGAASDPLGTLTLLISPSTKLLTLLLLLLPFAFLSLASPYVLLALPIIIQRFLSDREVLWGTEFHYSGILAPILAMSALDGLGRVNRRVSAATAQKVSGAFAVWSIAFVLVGMMASQMLFPFQRIVNGEAFRTYERQVDAEQILSLVPMGVCVEADDRLVPQLIPGRLVTLPGQSEGLATYVVLDLSQKEVGKDLPDPNAALAQAVADGFRIVAESGDIVLLSNDSPAAPECSQ